MDSVRAKLRAGEEDYDWLSSYHSRCFYTKFDPKADQLESGYLKSALLVQVCWLFKTFWLCRVLSPSKGLQSYIHITLFCKEYS